MKTFHITKNDFEGMACAILSKYIFGNNIEIEFASKFIPSFALERKIDINSHKFVIASGIQEKVQKDIPTIQVNTFRELYDKLSVMFPKEFDNQTLRLFNEHTDAYLDWSWREKELYLAKNMDELTKSMEKEDIINNIAERINNKELLITETEKAIIKAEKNRMSNSIEDRSLRTQKIGEYNAVFTFAENYKNELANILISKDINGFKADIAYIIDMHMGYVFVKYCKHNKMKNFHKKLENMGASIGKNNTAIIKFGNTFDKTIITSLTKNL